MSAETIGQISGLIVSVSIIPYAVRVLQRKIQPNLVSFSLWTVIGLALLLTYRSSGADSNIWPVVFGFFNPLLITLLALWRGERKRPERWEMFCGLVGLASIAWWGFVHDEPSQAQFALYLAIAADLCAAIPTIGFVWRSPQEDRPLAWILFGVGYGLAIFSITDHTFPNYALPIYMIAGSWTIAGILIAYRIRRRVPIAEWM